MTLSRSTDGDSEPYRVFEEELDTRIVTVTHDGQPVTMRECILTLGPDQLLARLGWQRLYELRDLKIPADLTPDDQVPIAESQISGFGESYRLDMEGLPPYSCKEMIAEVRTGSTDGQYLLEFFVMPELKWLFASLTRGDIILRAVGSIETVA